MPATLFILWIAVLPLIMWRGSYEGPKVLWFLFGGVALLCFWIFRVLKERKNFNFSKADLFYFLWLGILFLSSTVGIHPFESIIGGSYRHQGVIFFLLLWLVGKTVGILGGKQNKLLIKALAIVVLIESAVVVSQGALGHLYFGKPLGTLGEANAVAGFLATGSYFVFKSFPQVFLTLPLFSILMTGSRSGILATLASGGMVIESFAAKTRRILWLAVIFLSILLLIFLSSEKGSSPVENRPVIWGLGISQIIGRPILGYGAESGEAVYNIAFYKSGFPLSNIIVDRAHNLLIDVAMWSGITGLAAFCGWLYLSFKKLEIGKKFAFLSFLVYSMFQPLSIVHWVLLIIVLTS